MYLLNNEFPHICSTYLVSYKLHYWYLKEVTKHWTVILSHPHSENIFFPCHTTVVYLNYHETKLTIKLQVP